MQGGTFSYLLRRLLWVPLILFIVSSVTFVLAREGPGDPISILQGQYRDPEIRAQVRAQRGLDKPIWDQYVIYMKGVLTKGDLGQSYRYQGRSVREVLCAGDLAFVPVQWRRPLASARDRHPRRHIRRQASGHLGRPRLD